MKYLSICSGIEAASVAWHDFGWEPLGFAEIEPFPSEVLRQRFPGVTNYGDITRYKEWDIRPGTVDVLVGGPPCQAFSCAGLRAGLADPRGNLTLVYVGMVDHFKPRFFIYENVPGLLSSNGGRDFSAFVKAMADIGYGVCWRVLDAVNFGVPQRRRRVYLVGYPGNWRPPAAVLFESDCLRRDSKKSDGEGKETAATSGQGTSQSSWEDGLPKTIGTLCADTHPGAYSGQDAYTGRLIPHIKPIVIDRASFNQGENAQYNIRIEHTEVMDTVIAKGPHAVAHPQPEQGENEIEMAVRRITPREAERLQGFPDDWTRISWRGKSEEECPDGPRYKACGNSMATPVMRWIGLRLAFVDSVLQSKVCRTTSESSQTHSSNEQS